MATMRSGDATASGISQAQSTSAEPVQRADTPEHTAKHAGARRAETGVGSSIQHFDCTIIKIDKDGNEVMSDHLMPGEKLRRATTDAYSIAKTTERAEANRDAREDKRTS